MPTISQHSLEDSSKISCLFPSVTRRRSGTRDGEAAKLCVCGLPAGRRACTSVTVALMYLLQPGSSFGHDFVENVADVRFQMSTPRLGLRAASAKKPAWVSAME